MRPIDADELKKKLEAEHCDCEIVAMIDNMPTAAEAVKHGRWITHDRYQYKCSECETIFRSESQHIKRRGEFVWDIEEPRFCSRCGARMDGDTND